MPNLILKIQFILLIFTAFPGLYAHSGTITDKDTSDINSLLRKGQGLHYTNPDSAIYYYQLIFNLPGITPDHFSSASPELEKAYLKTIIKALNYSGNIYYYNDEYNRSEPYYQRSLALASAAGMKDMTGKALYDIGYVHYINNDYAEAAKLFERSYLTYAETGNKKGMYNARQASGLTYRRSGEFDKADSCLSECLQFAASLNDSMMYSDTRLNYGILLCEQGRLEEGIGMFEQALHYYEKEGDEQAVSTALLNVGVVLKMVEEYGKALAYMLRSAAIEELHQQKSQLVIRYYNLADLYLDMGEYEKAHEYCEKIQSVANEIGSRPFMAECDFLFGKYFFLLNDLSEAGDYFKSALAGASKTNNKTLIANIGLWYAKTCLKSENYNAAITLSTSAYEIADGLHLLLILKEASQVLSAAYEKSGKSQLALHWYKAFIAHSDSLSYFNQHKEISRIEAKYNFEQKEKENEILKDKASLQEQKLRNRSILNIAMISGFLLSFVIILLLIRRNRDARLLYSQQQMLNLQHLEEVEGELDGKNRELASKMMFLNQKNELIDRLIKRLQEIQQLHDNSSEELVSIVNELRIDAPQSNWKEFEMQFTKVHAGFYQRIYEKHPDLTSYEQRICAFLRMNLNTREIVSITGRSAKSIEVTRSRIRQKLKLKRDDNLSSFLAAI